MEKRIGILSALPCALLIFLLYSEVKAEMYVCVDQAGKEHYTNIVLSVRCKPVGKYFGTSGKPRTTYRHKQYDAAAYDLHISQVGRRYNVDPDLIKAVIKTESDFDPFALSKRGAQGLMQLMPETSRELKVRNPFDPRENIDGGTRYLRSMLDLFNNDISLSLAAYNAGPTLVRKLQKIPRIPETINYVKKVLAHYKGYRGEIPTTLVTLTANKVSS